jgi:sodium-independent sulfate anion transporter 11
LLQVVTNLKIGPSIEPKKWHVVVNTLFWLVGTSRNVILVVVAGLVGYHFASNAEPPFRVMGDIPPGLPTPRPPPFGFTETKNGTVCGRLGDDIRPWLGDNRGASDRHP